MKISLASILLIGVLSANAATLDVTVSGRAMPWTWTDGGQNSSFQFGIQNGSAPLVLDAVSGLAIAAGNSVTLAEVSGLVAACYDCPIVEGDGWSGSPANGSKGSTGTYFPSEYMKPYPIYLMALVGAFTDGSGNIVGHPFFIGSGPKSFAIPVGASALQLGFNDDNFSDDLGALNLRVSTQPIANAPEPAAILLSLLFLTALYLGRSISIF